MTEHNIEDLVQLHKPLAHGMAVVTRLGVHTHTWKAANRWRARASFDSHSGCMTAIAMTAEHTCQRTRASSPKLDVTASVMQKPLLLAVSS